MVKSSLEQTLSDLKAERYESTDKGFGRLYADVFKDKHRYNPTRKDFMVYDGKRWSTDTEGWRPEHQPKSYRMR